MLYVFGPPGFEPRRLDELPQSAPMPLDEWLRLVNPLEGAGPAAENLAQGSGPAGRSSRN
jgi:hypothetical protein